MARKPFRLTPLLKLGQNHNLLFTNERNVPLKRGMAERRFHSICARVALNFVELPLYIARIACYAMVSGWREPEIALRDNGPQARLEFTEDVLPAMRQNGRRQA